MSLFVSGYQRYLQLTLSVPLTDLLTQTALISHILPPDLSAGPSSSYLDRLVALPLSTLVKEPALISQEASTVEAELTNLCYREYSTFLSVHQCSTAVKSAFDDFQISLDRLLDSVPVLEDECKVFVDKTQSLSRNRNRAILVQESQDKLLDLLEIPRLMETCVRNGYYHEAMELAAHATSLPLEGNLVQDMLKEVEGVTQLMLSQLLSLLREPVKLPTVMKTIGYLRKLGLEDSTLGLAFLAGRLDNFRNHLLQIEMDRTEPARYVRKYIDLFREHVYDILSQYSAVFDDLDIVVSFANQCVSDLVELVTTYIPRIADPASLSSILIQLGYCSLSFARIGLDFGPLVAAPFADTVLAGYAHAVGAASSALGSTLKEAASGQGVPVDSLVDQSQKMSVNAGPSISAFPPLALFVNQNLAALNTLRLLAPSSYSKSLWTMLDQSLLDITVAIHDIIREPSQRTHVRTPSAPRAHLLRQNTETQLSPEVRASKRKEQQRLALALGESWIKVVHLLGESLSTGIFVQTYVESESLQTAVQRLRVTLDTMSAAQLNGSKSDPDGNGQASGMRPVDTDSFDAVRDAAEADAPDSVILPDLTQTFPANDSNSETEILEKREVVFVDPSGAGLEIIGASNEPSSAAPLVGSVNSTAIEDVPGPAAHVTAEGPLDPKAGSAKTPADLEQTSTGITDPVALVEPMFAAPVQNLELHAAAKSTPIVFPKEAESDTQVEEQPEQRAGAVGAKVAGPLLGDVVRSVESQAGLASDEEEESVTVGTVAVGVEDSQLDPASTSEAVTPITATPSSPSPAPSDSEKPVINSGNQSANPNKKKKKKKRK